VKWVKIAVKSIFRHIQNAAKAVNVARPLTGANSTAVPAVTAATILGQLNAFD
jgi:hypothetical protein